MDVRSHESVSLRTSETLAIIEPHSTNTIGSIFLSPDALAMEMQFIRTANNVG